MTPTVQRTLRMVGLLTVLVCLLGGCGQREKLRSYTDLWNAYAKHFLQSDGRIVDHSHDDQRTTSEGQAYSLFFALVANQPERFASILNWTQANLAMGSLANHLPAWLWGQRQDKSWGVIDSNSASDADLWIAYTLLQAGRLWSKPEYEDLGRKLAARIAANEVVDLEGVGPVLMPGPTGFGPDADGCYLINPSYVPLPVLSALADTVGKPWKAMSLGLPKFLGAATRNGFAVNWVQWCPSDGFGVSPSHGPIGSYDAVRVYLWAGMTSPDTPGAKPIMETLHGMADYLHTHGIPPEKVTVTTGKVDGEASVGFSAALLPYLQRLDMTEAFKNQRARLLDAHTRTGLYGMQSRYYTQILTLFALGYLSHAYRFDADGRLEVHWK